MSRSTKLVVIERWGDLGCACGCDRPVQPYNPACWHHIFPKALYPAFIDEADNLILVAVDCHADHEVASRRLPRSAIWRAEHLIADGSMARYIERTYPRV